ncbi:MAG: tRNA-dihydrouridine synthase family protein [Rectinemataceae bacterium]
MNRPFADGSLLLAPMVGISNRAFRTLVSELGPPDYAFTEMAGVEGFLSGGPEDPIYIDTAPDPDATSVQFFAKRPERLAEACRRLAGLPDGSRPRGVDINFGCAAPKIRRSGGGSAWSADPEGAVRLIAAARAAWPGLLSAKLRSGEDDNPERLLAYCRRLADAGLDFLTLHPRTDAQRFRRAANPDLIGVLASGLPIPVVGNGDLRSPADVARMFSVQKPAAVMIGREAARRPWIFASLRESASLREPALLGASPSDPHVHARHDGEAIGLHFLDLAEALLPEAWRLESAKRFFSYYADNFSFAHYLRTNLAKAPDIGAMRSTFSSYFDQVPQDRKILT